VGGAIVSLPGDPTIVAIDGRTDPTDLARLCDQVTARLLSSDEPGFACEVHPDAPKNLAVIDALARLALTARRTGRAFWLRGRDPYLNALIDLCGLAGQLASDGSDVDVGGQAELREEPRGVQEESDTRNPTA
jgi:hypothetical protein